MSRCKLFLRAFGGIFIWPTYFIAIFVVVIISFLQGHRLDDKAKFVKIPYLHRFPPALFLTISWAVFSFWFAYLASVDKVLRKSHRDLWDISIISVAILIVAGVFWSCEYFGTLWRERQNSVRFQRLKTWLQAWKERHCAMVTIE